MDLATVKAQCEALASVIERECFSDEEFAEVMRGVPEAPLQERYTALAEAATALFPSDDEADGLGERLRVELLRGVREAVVTGSVGDLASTVAKIDAQATRVRRLWSRLAPAESQVEAPVQLEGDASEASRIGAMLAANYPQGKEGIALGKAMLKDLDAAAKAMLDEVERRTGRLAVPAIREIVANQQALVDAISAIADSREQASRVSAPVTH